MGSQDAGLTPTGGSREEYEDSKRRKRTKPSLAAKRQKWEAERLRKVALGDIEDSHQAYREKRMKSNNTEKYRMLAECRFCGACGKYMAPSEFDSLTIKMLTVDGCLVNPGDRLGVLKVLVHSPCVKRVKVQGPGVGDPMPPIKVYEEIAMGYTVDGAKLQEKRVDSGASLQALASDLGWSSNKVSNVLYGNQRTVSVEDAKNLEFLGYGECVGSPSRVVYVLIEGMEDQAKNRGVFKSDVEGGLAGRSWASLGGSKVTRETAEKLQVAFDEARMMPMYRVKRAAGEVRSLEELL